MGDSGGATWLLLLPVSQLTLAGVPSPSYPPVARWGGGRETCWLLVLLADTSSPSKPPVSRWWGTGGVKLAGPPPRRNTHHEGWGDWEEGGWRAEHVLSRGRLTLE